MKFKILITLAAAVLAVCSFAGGHIGTVYGRATTTKAKYGFVHTINNLTVSSDTTAGTDTLWVGVGRDTLSHGANAFPILFVLTVGEKITFEGCQADTVWIWTSAHTIKFRAWGVY